MAKGRTALITGTVSDAGVPTITLTVAGQLWTAIVDTGFNGDLELPERLRGLLNARHVGRVMSALAGGQIIEEDAFQIEFPFDGQLLVAKTPDGKPLALWANYACHCTTLGGDFNRICGDWTGYA